jgi:hypothetical protein
MLFPPETWWLIAITDQDPDNGELHGPEITVHHGFVREDLMEIFKKVGFTTIQNDEFDHIATVSTKIFTKEKDRHELMLNIVVEFIIDSRSNDF